MIERTILETTTEETGETIRNEETEETTIVTTLATGIATGAGMTVARTVPETHILPNLKIGDRQRQRTGLPTQVRPASYPYIHCLTFLFHLAPPAPSSSMSRPNLDPDAPDTMEGEEGEEMDATNDDDDAMMAMMGMSGFGTTKVFSPWSWFVWRLQSIGLRGNKSTETKKVPSM